MQSDSTSHLGKNDLTNYVHFTLAYTYIISWARTEIDPKSSSKPATMLLPMETHEHGYKMCLVKFQ